MRLLDTDSLELKEFFGEEIPAYAILSHRWEEEEVLFQDMIDKTFASKKGFGKLAGACRRAAIEGHEYLWCDTTCIDKSSSAELSEAINSMFAWYEGSAICYAYISDVSCDACPTPSDLDFIFRKSKWFTRGWTLQELLAPKHVAFYDQHWNAFGSREYWARTISEVTSIPKLSLEFGRHKTDAVAQKMSWVSRRTTTRVEDIAYCMLGLFGVYMPPLYGEGKHAFQRLQLEILKISDDESIFAWKADPEEHLKYPHRGLLAQSPSEFKECHAMSRIYGRHNPPYSMTNKGMAIGLPLDILSYCLVDWGAGEFRVSTTYVAELNCMDATNAIDGRWPVVCIFLKQQHGEVVLSRVFPQRYAAPKPAPGVSVFFPGVSSDQIERGVLNKKQTIRHGELFYVRQPQYPLVDSNDPKVEDVRVVGSDLQRLLSVILTMEDQWNHWVEYEPYHFFFSNGGWKPIALAFTHSTSDDLSKTNRNLIVVMICHLVDKFVSRITTVSHTTMKIWNKQPNFRDWDPDVEKAQMGSHIPDRFEGQTPWVTGGWATTIPAWNRILKMEVVHGSEYTLSLGEPETAGQPHGFLRETFSTHRPPYRGQWSFSNGIRQ